MANYSTYFAIEKKLKQSGFDLDRRELILLFTDNKKNSLKQLSANDYREFILWINRKFPANDTPKPTQFVNAMEQLRSSSMNLVLANAKISTAYAQNISDESLKKDKMRKKIIALFCKMGYKDQYACADMARINAWVLKYGFLNVKMNSYSYQELPNLVSQVEIVCTKYLQELNKPQA